MKYFLGGFIFLMSILAFFHWLALRKHAVVNQWIKHLDLTRHQHIYEQLFSSVDGFELSRQSRLKQDAFDYTYGEIEFISFIALIGLTHPDEATLFYDLGSGVGKAVFACSMVFNVGKSCGIELFDSLHQAALAQKNQLIQHPHYADKANTISFIQANFLDCDFYDATLVFINATAFFGETWNAINRQLENLKPGAIVITSSKKLLSSAFIVIRVTSVCMSWGTVSAFIHKRIDATIYS